MSAQITKLVWFSLSLSLLLLLSQTAFAQSNYKPEGIRLIENKSFDDSDAARGEIPDLVWCRIDNERAWRQAAKAGPQEHILPGSYSNFQVISC